MCNRYLHFQHPNLFDSFDIEIGSLVQWRKSITFAAEFQNSRDALQVFSKLVHLYFDTRSASGWCISRFSNRVVVCFRARWRMAYRSIGVLQTCIEFGTSVLYQGTHFKIFGLVYQLAKRHLSHLFGDGFFNCDTRG